MVTSMYCSCRGLKSAPSRHTGRLTTASNSSCGVSVTSGLHKYLHPCAHTYTQTRHDSYTEVTGRSLTPAAQSLNSGKFIPASRTSVCMQITWDLVKLLIQCSQAGAWNSAFLRHVQVLLGWLTGSWLSSKYTFLQWMRAILPSVGGVCERKF